MLSPHRHHRQEAHHQPLLAQLGNFAQICNIIKTKTEAVWAGKKTLAVRSAPLWNARNWRVSPTAAHFVGLFRRADAPNPHKEPLADGRYAFRGTRFLPSLLLLPQLAINNLWCFFFSPPARSAHGVVLTWKTLPSQNCGLLTSSRCFPCACVQPANIVLLSRVRTGAQVRCTTMLTYVACRRRGRALAVPVQPWGVLSCSITSHKPQKSTAL